MAREVVGGAAITARAESVLLAVDSALWDTLLEIREGQTVVL